MANWIEFRNYAEAERDLEIVNVSHIAEFDVHESDNDGERVYWLRARILMTVGDQGSVVRYLAKYNSDESARADLEKILTDGRPLVSAPYKPRVVRTARMV